MGVFRQPPLTQLHIYRVYLAESGPDVISVSPGVASGTGTAYDSITAGLASATGSAGSAAPHVKPNAGQSSGTGISRTPAASIKPTAGLGAGTGTAGTPSLHIKPTSGLASGTGAANNAAVATAASADIATGTATAYDATVTTGAAETNAPAEHASGTGTAYDAAISLAPSSALSSGTGLAGNAAGSVAGSAGATASGSASGPSASIAVGSGAASGTGAAIDATVTTGADTNASAGHASGTGTASGASISLASSASAGTGSGAAGGSASSVKVTPGAAAGTGAASNATITLASGTANAGVATGTGAAYGPAKWVLPGLAWGSGDAHDVADTGLANAGVATGTGQAFGAFPINFGAAQPTPGVETPVATITYDGIDITADVMFSTARFTSAANGATGTAVLRVRDDGHTYQFVTGRRLDLYIEDVLVWAGFVASVRRGFWTVGGLGGAERERYFEIQGADVNILFQRRFLFDLDDPTKVQLTTFPAETDDDVVVRRYLRDHLTLQGDGVGTSKIEHVGTPSIDQEISGAAGWSWGEFMNMIIRDTGALYYLDPDRDLVLTDVDVPNADFGLTDNPQLVLFEDDFNRTVANGLGGSWVMSALSQDASDASVDGSVVVCTDEIDYLTPWALPTHGSAQFDFYVPSDTTIFQYYYLDITARREFAGPLYSGGGLEAYADGDGTWFFVSEGAVLNFTPETNTWYTIRGWMSTDGMSDKIKVWKRDEPEPLEWMDEGASFKSSMGTYQTTLYMFADGEDAMLDNIRVWRGQVEFPSFGYRVLEIHADGAKLVNDAMVWGAGQGSAYVKFKRVTDDDSVAEHGLWQTAEFNQTAWRQSTVNRMARTQVYGSPQNKRGGKDDAIGVRCTIYRNGLRVGQKVSFRSEVYDYADVLPVRAMTVDFPTPTTARYDLTLGHEIDVPWSTFEFWMPSINIGGIDIGEFGGLDFGGLDLHLPGLDPCAPSGCDGCIEHFVGLGEWGPSTIQCAEWQDAGSTANASIQRQAGVGRMIAEPHGFATRYVELPNPPAVMGDYEVLVKVNLHLAEHPTASFNGGAAEFSVLISDGTGPNSIKIQDFTSGSSPYGGAQHYTLGGVYSGTSGGGGAFETALHGFALTKGNNTGAAQATGAAGDGDEIYIKLNYASNGVSVKVWKVGDAEPGGTGQSQTGNTLPTCPFLILRLVARDTADLGFGTSEQATADIDFIQVTSGIECSDIVTVGSAMGLFGEASCFDDFDINDTNEWPGWTDGGPVSAATPDTLFANGGFGIYEGNNYHYIWKENLLVGADVHETLTHVNLRFDRDNDNWEFATTMDGTPDPPTSSDWIYAFFDFQETSFGSPPRTYEMFVNFDGPYGATGTVGTGITKVMVTDASFIEFDFWARLRIDYDLHKQYVRFWENGDSEPGTWDYEFEDLGWDPPSHMIFSGFQLEGEYTDSLSHSSTKVYGHEVTEGCSGGADPCFDGIGTPGFEETTPGSPGQHELELIDTPSGEDPTSTWFLVSNYFRQETIYLNGLLLRRNIDYIPHYNERWIEILSSITITPADSVFATYEVYMPGPEEVE